MTFIATFWKENCGWVEKEIAAESLGDAVRMARKIEKINNVKLSGVKRK